MLQYVIYCGNTLVARFLYEVDREIAFMVMVERNPGGDYLKGVYQEEEES